FAASGSIRPRRAGSISWPNARVIGDPCSDGAFTMKMLMQCARSIVLLLLSAGMLPAEDGAALYKQICAACHDAGIDRAPGRDALRAMTPERVLAALENGAMISMTAGRTATERRAVAEFVTGKPF